MNSRCVDPERITEAVKALFIQANTVLRPDVVSAIKGLRKVETVSEAADMLDILVENACIASEKGIPICQDTGIAVVFLEIGANISFLGGDVTAAVNEGVKRAYSEGCLRKSVVEDPMNRNNTGTNTPAIIHVDMLPGDKLKISVLPKGFGSENKGAVVMLNPTSGEEAIVEFAVEAVRRAGPDACPPYMLGIGIGGTMDKAALLAKKALLRDVGSVNPKEHIARMEKEIMRRVRELGIGIMGLGGSSTIMGVNIMEAPTHIAGLPVAVNISCHALRSASMEL